MNSELKRRVETNGSFRNHPNSFRDTCSHYIMHMVLRQTFIPTKSLQDLYRSCEFQLGSFQVHGQFGTFKWPTWIWKRFTSLTKKITLLLCKQWTAGNTDKKTFHLFTIPFAWSQHLLRSVGTLWKWLWKSNYRGRSIADSLCYWILLFSTFVLTWICLLRRPQSQTAAQGNFSIQCHLPKKYIKINISK